jgi:hypothetical protein
MTTSSTFVIRARAIPSRDAAAGGDDQVPKTHPGATVSAGVNQVSTCWLRAKASRQPEPGAQ